MKSKLMLNRCKKKLYFKILLLIRKKWVKNKNKNKKKNKVEFTLSLSFYRRKYKKIVYNIINYVVTLCFLT